MYSILYDGSRKILKLFGEEGAIFEKKLKFENRPLPIWGEIYVLLTMKIEFKYKLKSKRNN